MLHQTGLDEIYEIESMLLTDFYDSAHLFETTRYNGLYECKTFEEYSKMYNEQNESIDPADD
jgi:hypothetical protein